MADDKPIVQFEDFTKLDLRVAKVMAVDEHPNADKLLVLTVDLGGEQRQIIAGLRGFYEPDALVGRQIVVVANLQPRKMRGLESQGMLLAAVVGGEAMDNVVVIGPEQEVPAGTSVS
ncbi:MAG: methionine--tRNA ligase subunit beta [Phycisphaerae bacterium]|nr:methionine--tRNA ligase subunit beta [Phycisphaerae bacterium]